jgi:hypothetical protein
MMQEYSFSHSLSYYLYMESLEHFIKTFYLNMDVK